MTDRGRDGGSTPVRRRRYGIAAAALVLLAVVGLAVADQTDPGAVAPQVDVAHLDVGGPVPSLNAAAGWINSPPLPRAELAGKVVLYDFWTYSCINCIRTLPQLMSWSQRYAPDGLVVVGVHSPEFDFEKDHGNVRDAVARLGVDYPVALDDSMSIWSAFGANYWPETFVADRQGRQRYHHIGEGDERQTEDVLRSLLGVPAGAPRASAPSTDAGRAPESGDHVTPETYLGTARGEADAVRLVGGWSADDERVRSTRAGAEIVLRYRAREVNLVMAAPDQPPGVPIEVTVELDGRPQAPVQVLASDRYRLVLTRGIEEHVVRVRASGPGLEAYAFTFGS